jgi:hypothetical protein
MDLVVVVKLSPALLEVLDPIEACVLNLWRKMSLHLAIVNIGHEKSVGAYATDVLLERV